MKKTEGHGYVEWTCPYVKCKFNNTDNYDEATMSEFDGKPLVCSKCKKNVMVEVY